MNKIMFFLALCAILVFVACAETGADEDLIFLKRVDEEISARFCARINSIGYLRVIDGNSVLLSEPAKRRGEYQIGEDLAACGLVEMREWETPDGNMFILEVTYEGHKLRQTLNQLE